MRNNVKRMLLMVAMAALIGAVLSACSQATEAPTEEGFSGVQAPVSKDVNLDPTQAQDADSKIVNDFIYEPLVNNDGTNPTTWLANSWTVAEDDLAYTFELRTDIEFSDSTPLNADAVVATFTRWFDPEDPGHGSGEYKGWLDTFGGFKGETDAEGKKKSAFDGAEKTGDYTVVLHLNRPVPDLLTKLATMNFYITKPAADGTSYLGTGPYMVGARTDQHLVLVANPHYSGPYPAAGDLEFPFK